MKQIENQPEFDGSAAKRIMDAIMGTPAPHPLSKSPCKECGEMVCKKDMQHHLDEHLAFYEMVAQIESEWEAYRIAHS
jgi:hypothetical protein